jgi:stress response protein YsnF
MLLANEQLSVHKRRVETGRVRINTIVEEHQAWIQEALEREAVSIERVNVDRIVDSYPIIRRRATC